MPGQSSIHGIHGATFQRMSHELCEFFVKGFASGTKQSETRMPRAQMVISGRVIQCAAAAVGQNVNGRVKNWLNSWLSQVEFNHVQWLNRSTELPKVWKMCIYNLQLSNCPAIICSRVTTQFGSCRPLRYGMPALQFSLLKLHRHDQQNASGKLRWKVKGKWFVAAQDLSSLLTLTFVAVQHAFEVPATQG